MRITRAIEYPRITSDYPRSRLRVIRAYIDLAVPRLIKIYLERAAGRFPMQTAEVYNGIVHFSRYRVEFWKLPIIRAALERELRAIGYITYRELPVSIKLLFLRISRDELLGRAWSAGRIDGEAGGGRERGERRDEFSLGRERNLLTVLRVRCM